MSIPKPLKSRKASDKSLALGTSCDDKQYRQIVQKVWRDQGDWLGVSGAGGMGM